jgi:hypothetical protein
MRFSKGWTLVLCLLVAAVFVATTFAQETTAGIQGTVKDPQGAVVSKAVVEVTSPALIGVKKVETDNGGYYHIVNLPPGIYNVTVSAQGFRTVKQMNIPLEVGKLPTLDLKLEVGATEQTIEVSSEAPLVDTTQSKVQTNVTADTLNGIPKGRSFQSVIQFAPGARYEPLQSTGGYNGYQIDGASNAENSFLVEGQETKDVSSGQTKTNTPIEFIQEVQVKSAGFEAEYGGALGGVINVIQKRGGNAWHGSIFTYYRGDAFNAAPSRQERYEPFGTGYNYWDPTDPAAAPDSGPRMDAETQMYQPKKDHYRIVEPGFEAGGYLKKDTVWLFLSSVPEAQSYRRTVNFHGSTGNRNFNEDIQTYYSLARADARITNKIRVYGSWQYAYERASGSTLPNADDAYGLYNTSTANSPDNYQHGIGYVAPNLIWNIGADVTITPNLVATTRFGRFYNDYQDRGLPVGMRYRWISSNYTGGTYLGHAAPATLTALDGETLGTTFASGVHASAYSTIGANYQTIYNQYARRGLSQDIAWFKKGLLGTHNIKGGYQQNQLHNNQNQGYNKAQAYVAYGVSYLTLPSTTTCSDIVAQNLAKGWASGATYDSNGNLVGCQGLWGTYNIREYGVIGNVTSYNHALYLQDAWTLGKGVTLNLGVRFDKEGVPSYDPALPGIGFDFNQKFAPRFGGAWDVLQNGKFKVYGSFGYFYDIMNLNLPMGSFGGSYWHDCVYTLDDPDYTKIQPVRDPVHFCNPSGGANGQVTGRFIENKDFRVYSNDPANYRIDPNLKPMKQHEMVLGSEWAINPKLAFEARYSRKRLDRTIEDAGLVTGAGEIFYIINPGEGIHKQPLGSSECVGCATQPKAMRDFDGIEFRLVRRESSNWFGTVSYTYSKLRGNYAGLTNSDVADGGAAGRSDPNNNRSFDEPFMQYDSHGKPINGPLATDRPNEIKAFGYYRLKWSGGRNDTLIGLTQNAFSGTPLSTYIDVQSGGTPVYVEGRGKWIPTTQSGPNGDWVFGNPIEKRTPFFTQTDVNLVHTLHISKTDESKTLSFTVNVTNLFNQRTAVSYDQQIDSAYDGGALGNVNLANIPADSVSKFDYKTYMTGYDWRALANAQHLILSSGYGQPNLFQDGRAFRFQVKYTF